MPDRRSIQASEHVALVRPEDTRRGSSTINSSLIVVIVLQLQQRRAGGAQTRRDKGISRIPRWDHHRDCGEKLIP